MGVIPGLGAIPGPIGAIGFITGDGTWYSETFEISAKARDFSDLASFAIKIRISISCGPILREDSHNFDMTSRAFTSVLNTGVRVLDSRELAVAFAKRRRVSRSRVVSLSFSISASFLAYAVCFTQYNLNIGAC